MAKSIIRSLLLLSTVFLTGYGSSLAHAFSDGTHCVSAKVDERLGHVSAGLTKEIGDLLTFASPERPVLKVHVREVRENEEDEHESKPFRKNLLSSSKYFAAVFCGQIMARYFRQISPYPYRRHLVVKVFRL